MTWGYLILALVALAVSYRALDRWLDRAISHIERDPAALHREQMLRWLAGRGPDPREALFRNGVPVDQNEAPELSSLSWPTPPLAISPTPTQTHGSSTDMGSSTATSPG